MLRRWLIALFCLLPWTAHADMMPDIVNASSNVSAYTGPLDLVAGANGWWGVRAGSAAFAATQGPIINLRRTKDNATCDFNVTATGGVGLSASGCAQGAGLTPAAFATTDATASSCTASTGSLSCTGGSSTPHAFALITGTGITQPCIVNNAGGGGTLPAITATMLGRTVTAPCGSFSGVATTFTYGLEVATLYDQAGAHNLTQATSAAQPQFMPNCAGTGASLPCLFGAQGPWMANTSFGTHVQPNSVSGVDYNINSPNAAFLWSFNAPRNQWLTGSNRGAFCGTSAVSTPATDFVWHANQQICNTTSSINIDNTIATGSAGSSGVGGNALLLSEAGGAGPSWAMVTEFGIWEGLAFSTTQQTSLCNNQSAYWGTPTCPTPGYAGPCDVVSGATGWYGLRACSAAYAAAQGKAVNLRRASDNTACDFDIATSGNLGNSDAGCSLGGGLTLAAFATVDATATCTIATTTATCTSGSAVPHGNSTLTGAGVTQPCYATAAGVGTAGSFTIALAGNGQASPCGTIGSGVPITFTYGLFIAQAYDQTGNSNSVTQVTSANQPQLLPNCINSLPCMSGPASGGHFLTATISSTGNASIAAVAQRNFAFTTISTMLGKTNSATLTFPISANTIALNASQTLSSVADQSPHAIQAAYGATSNLCADGTCSTAAVAAPAAGTTLGVMATAGSANTLQGFEGEAGFWATAAFTTGQIASMCHNQSTYWGTTPAC